MGVEIIFSYADKLYIHSFFVVKYQQIVGLGQCRLRLLVVQDYILFSIIHQTTTSDSLSHIVVCPLKKVLIDLMN